MTLTCLDINDNDNRQHAGASEIKPKHADLRVVGSETIHLKQHPVGRVPI